MRGLGLHWAWVPFFTFLLGLSVIVSLLVLWLTDGHPRYRGDEATVVYISDVGAAHHSVFMGLAIPTAVFFFICIALDFHLRHIRRIPERQRRRERAWAGIALFFAFSTMLFCILLTIFDAFNHGNLHWGFAVVFFISLVICGIAMLVEIAHLSRDYRQDFLLRTSFFIKLTIILLGVASLISIAIIAGICNNRTVPGVDKTVTCDHPMSGEAALEWFLAFLFLLFIGSLCLDLLPSRYTSKHVAHHGGPVVTPELGMTNRDNTNEMNRDPEIPHQHPVGNGYGPGLQHHEQTGVPAANLPTEATRTRSII